MIKRKTTYQVDKSIKITAKQHDSLVDLLKEKLMDQKDYHESRNERFEKIDKQVYGYLVLDDDDTKRQIDNEKGYGIKPVDVSLPLTVVQLDEAVTYFMEVLAADSGLYGAIAPKDKQAVATAFASVMNENADKFMHERYLARFLFDAMKYNFAALTPQWKVLTGNRLENSETEQPVVVEGAEVYAGNTLRDIDPYNLFYDLSVDAINMAQEGEFFAEATIKSPFRMKKMLDDGEIYNIESLMEKENFSLRWYTQRPVVNLQGVHSTRKESWINILGGHDSVSTTKKAVENVIFHIWIPLKKYGLGTSDKLQICRIILVNNEIIGRVQVLNNSHALLPIGISMPIDDGFNEETQSYAELLMPFQTFASAQMNIHQKASRRALYGVTFYNKNVIDLNDEYDPVASKIAVNAPPEADLRKAIYQVFDAPKTSNTLQDIEVVNSLMQKVLPTEILKQVAGLERATQYQAAATVQGANRRNLKLAKIIHAQAFSPVKIMQMFNILQYQKSMEILTLEGELIEVNPAEFRDTKLEFSISDGLKGLDKMSITMAIKEVLNTIVQSQQASQQFDVVAMINYWTSLLGDKTDFSQFEFKSEIDKLTPEQKNLAFQLLQQYSQQQEGGQQTLQQQQLPL